MTPKRFETLAEAFGGDVARWPDADREAAATLMAAEPAWAEAILARAGDLDAVLATYVPPPPPVDLAERIAAAAPRSQVRVRPRWVGWLLPVGMGAGLAASCAAGLLMGFVLSAEPSATSEDFPDATMTATAEDDFGFDLDEEIG